MGRDDGVILLHSEATFFQLASIEGATLLAPKGQHDDRADAFALAQLARPISLMHPAPRPLLQAAAKGWS